MDSPFEIALYDKTLERIGWVGDPIRLHVTPAHNQQPFASLTVDDDHRYARALATPGTRVVIHYLDEYTIGGPVHLTRAHTEGTGDLRTFEIRDDWSIFTRVLAWPNPAGTILQQGANGTHDVRTGPAESVVKGYLTANLARLGSGAHHLPVTVAPTQGRGSSITVQARMQPIADNVFPLADQAGIGTTVRQTLTGLTVDCYEPVQWPIDLSRDGGTLVGNDWSLRAPETTRVVIGADGDGVDRVFRGPFINIDAEAAYRTVLERFVDARDLDSDDPQFETLVAARAAQALAEGAARSGLAVRLAETEVFRYGGQGVHVGDLVTVELDPATDTDPAVTVTDVIRTATLTWSAEGGALATPTVGDRFDDPTQTLARAIAAVARRQRTTQAGG